MQKWEKEAELLDKILDELFVEQIVEVLVDPHGKPIGILVVETITKKTVKKER